MTPEQRADEAIRIISRFMKPELTSLFRQVEANALERAACVAESYRAFEIAAAIRALANKEGG